eukprot:2177555-Rhodomonas_salina.1
MAYLQRHVAVPQRGRAVLGERVALGRDRKRAEGFGGGGRKRLDFCPHDVQRVHRAVRQEDLERSLGLDIYSSATGQVRAHGRALGELEELTVLGKTVSCRLKGAKNMRVLQAVRWGVD